MLRSRKVALFGDARLGQIVASQLANDFATAEDQHAMADMGELIVFR